MMAIAAKRGYVAEAMDVATAFQPSQIEEVLFVREAPGNEVTDKATELL